MDQEHDSPESKDEMNAAEHCLLKKSMLNGRLSSSEECDDSLASRA
jgi:hypothetical protein